MLPELIELIGVLACAVFAGAAIYISVVEHPARLSCGTEIAATQWAPSYHRATLMQVPLAVIAALLGAWRWLLGGSALWIWAAAVILTVIPYTLVVIFPTNKLLLDPRRDRATAETRRLLEKWGRLHAVRTIVSTVASILFIWAAIVS